VNINRFLLLGLVYFRFAEFEDSNKLFNWRNDLEVRKICKNKKEITFPEHEKWIKNTFTNPNIIILIILNEKYEEIGQTRLDKNKDENIISISLKKEFRNKGYGTISIIKATNLFIKYFNINKITAEIFENNIPSIKAFTKANYKYITTKEHFNKYEFMVSKNEN